MGYLSLQHVIARLVRRKPCPLPHIAIIERKVARATLSSGGLEGLQPSGNDIFKELYDQFMTVDLIFWPQKHVLRSIEANVDAKLSCHPSPAAHMCRRRCREAGVPGPFLRLHFSPNTSLPPLRLGYIDCWHPSSNLSTFHHAYHLFPGPCHPCPRLHDPHACH